MNIAIITSSHFHYDDRIYYHMANSLSENGHKVEIISSLSEMNVDAAISIQSFDGNSLSKNKKIAVFIERLTLFNPQIIICSEPLTVLAAHKYSKKNNTKIIYDITEWYPSKKNLVNYHPSIKWFHFLKFSAYNLHSYSISDGFIFGEYYKSKIPKLLFPKKPYEYTSYYPDLRFFKENKPQITDHILRLSYSGKISIEKGFVNFINVVKELSEQNPNLNIYIKTIGWYDEKDDKICKDLIYNLNKNIKFIFHKTKKLADYIDLISDTDIFMDLRNNDFENTHCLPIKLFYYIALERPVIFSDLKAIRKEIDLNQFGYLVNPTDSKKIADIILNYHNHKNHYYQHCSKAHQLYKTNYNWQKIEPEFLKFMNQMAQQ